MNCLRFLFAIAAMMVPALACAQSQDASDGQLEEVLVTAQKREQDLQEVPISISAFSGEYLEGRGAGTIEDVSRMSPNFAVANGSQQTNSIVTIRGIGSVGNNAIEPSVGIFIDGIYYPRAGSLIGQLADVGSFEVLRGPQGTLFGRNTPVGALNITTRNPSPVASSSLLAAWGDHDSFELQAVANGGLGESVSGRLAVQYLDQGSPWFNQLDSRRFGARENLVARGKLLFDPEGPVWLLLILDRARLVTTGVAIEVLNASAVPAFDNRLNALYGSTATTADPYDGRVNQVHEDHLEDEQGGIAADLRYSFGNGMQLRSLSAWRNWNADVLESAIRVPGDILPRFTLFGTRTLSQEIQLLSPARGRVDWVAGLYLYDEQYDIHQGFHAGDDFCVPTVELLRGNAAAQDCLTHPQQRFTESDFDQNLDSTAIFGQATWRISRQMSSTFGLRWTRDRKQADFIQAVTNPYAALVRVPESATGMRLADSRSTWLANFSWFPLQDMMLFATVSSGYKSGGFNPEGANEVLGAQRRAFDAETSTNFELGLKRTLRGRMTVNVTAFRTWLDDFQERAFDGVSFRVLNVGKLRQQGIEADLRWKPVSPLSLRAGASYLDSQYLDFPAAPPLPGSTPPQDLTGTRKTTSPRWEISADADLDLRVSARIAAFVGAGVQYTSRQNIGLIPNNNPQSVQPAYSLLHARIGLRADSGRWDIAVIGNNLAGKGYCLTIADQPLGTALGAVDAATQSSVQRCVLGAPRSWKLGLRWRY